MVAVSRHMHPGQLSVEGSVKPSTLRSSQTPTSWLGKKATGSQCIVASLRRLSEICRSTFVGVDAGQRCRGALAEVCFERPPGGSVCADRGKSRARGKSCSETQSYRSQKSIALDSRLQGATTPSGGTQRKTCWLIARPKNLMQAVSQKSSTVVVLESSCLYRHWFSAFD